jgi:hypothetical protein
LIRGDVILARGCKPVGVLELKGEGAPEARLVYLLGAFIAAALTSWSLAKY